MAAKLDLTGIPEPVIRVLVDVVNTFRGKNADYAEPGKWRGNFDSVARQMSCRAIDIADTMVAVKQDRLRNLRGKDPVNEAIEDTYLDRTVYSVISQALYLEDKDG